MLSAGLPCKGTGRSHHVICNHSHRLNELATNSISFNGLNVFLCWPTVTLHQRQGHRNKYGHNYDWRISQNDNSQTHTDTINNNSKTNKQTNKMAKPYKCFQSPALIYQILCSDVTICRTIKKKINFRLGYSYTKWTISVFWFLWRSVFVDIRDTPILNWANEFL